MKRYKEFKDSSIINKLRESTMYKPEVLESESGVFYHIDGMVNGFVPAADNVIDGGTEAPDGRSGRIRHYPNAVKTLIVPDGVKGVADGFFRDCVVTEGMVFPDSLMSIGSKTGFKGAFVYCSLPEFEMPASVNSLGNYVFGHSYIKKLVLRPSNVSPYGRQFKDSTIEELYLPKSVLTALRTSAGDEEYGFYRNFQNHCNCRITEY